MQRSALRRIGDAHCKVPASILVPEGVHVYAVAGDADRNLSVAQAPSDADFPKRGMPSQWKHRR